ncbi:MAG: hypothetical protein QGG36_09590 [Pirellulaceae bacterium]|nr:hypothetical protein [Pirellulaceae bacterium]
MHLSQIVAGKEVLFQPGDEGEYGEDIDLSSDISSGKVRVFDVSATELKAFRDQFDSLYLGDLDDGEAESLAYLTKQTDDFLISSGDAIVYRVLGNLSRRDQGLSLEEILQRIGLGRRLEWAYSQAFREKYTMDGETDMIQRRGKKT